MEEIRRTREDVRRLHVESGRWWSVVGEGRGRRGARGDDVRTRPAAGQDEAVDVAGCRDGR